MGSIGAFVGLVLGVVGLIITINASKSYSHQVGAGFILSILGTIFSLGLFLGWTCFGLNDGYSYFGVCGVGCHEINQTCNSFHCPG